ncbi:Thiamine repressible regulatory protein [Wickerhamomyces ciferrii]|uniref:Thiamine repressible regulatory protein n=1 Tax=Wickerhamomyces ciferrii (strain ATCC 14091 / BCRC 22168 / CBS 111 / JCM 3599 / NBRC 0793 / NRRL Y-1031 F-60-10) TaxID=1206466 RepID=K0L0Q9_WICCF|nr:Thiamine repressible regulatory protein [Wickerhamomyces ciferrii]CCH47038.1 Thiamine repressible regulatory protein [Wickerhamomyces ciferrii]
MSDSLNNNLHDSVDESESTNMKKRRVGKACDCCRMKKTKCDGVKPCSRCKIHNHLCSYTERRSSFHKEYQEGYVELLEARLSLLTRCLHKFHQMVDNGDDVSNLKVKDKKELSINKLVSLLENDEHYGNEINDDLGVWDKGIEIASKFDENNSNYMKSACSEFADHFKTGIHGASTKGRKRTRKGRNPKLIEKKATKKFKCITNNESDYHEFERSSSPSLPQSPIIETDITTETNKPINESPSSLLLSPDDEIPLSTESLFITRNPFNNNQALDQSSLPIIPTNVEDEFIEQNSNINNNNNNNNNNEDNYLLYGNSNPEILPMRFWPYYSEIPEGSVYNEVNGFNYYPQVNTNPVNFL